MKKACSIFLTLCCGSISLPCPAESLLQVYQHAKQNNAELRAVAAQRDAALQKINQVRGALLPHLGLQASYQMGQKKENSPEKRNLWGQTTGGHSTRYVNTGGINLNLSQSIVDFAKWRKLSMAEKEANAAQVLYRLEQQKLIFNTAIRYIQVLEALEKLNLLTTEKLAYARKLEEIKQGLAVGYKSTLDFCRAQTEYDYKLALEVQAQDKVDQAMEELSQITGQRYVQLNALEPKCFNPQQPSSVNTLIRESEQGNLELLYSRLKQNLAREGVRLAQTGHLPTLSFSASAGHGAIKTRFGDSMDKNSTRDLFGKVAFDLPLFSGGAVYSKVKQQQYELVEASEKLEAAHRATVSKVRNARNSIVNNIKCNDNYQNALISSQRLLAATEAHFQAGINTMVDILHARHLLFQAKESLSRARTGYLVSLLGLKQVTGQLSEQDLSTLNEILKVPASLKPTVTKQHAEKKLVPPRKRAPVKRPLKKQLQKRTKKADLLVLHRQ